MHHLAILLPMTGEANAVVTSLLRKVSTRLWKQALAGLLGFISGITVVIPRAGLKSEDRERGHVDFTFLHAEIFL